MGLFSFIGRLFASIGAALQKEYNKLSDAEKASLESGTGIVEIINENLSAAPAAVRAAIQKAFPNLTEQVLETAAFQVATMFGAKDLSNFDDAVKEIQAHLRSLNGKTWETASHAAALLFAGLFAGPDKKIQVFTSLIEWAYQKFVKKAI